MSDEVYGYALRVLRQQEEIVDLKARLEAAELERDFAREQLAASTETLVFATECSVRDKATIERLVAAGNGLVAFAAGALANDEGLSLLAVWEKAKALPFNMG